MDNQETEKKPVILSGIQTSGKLTIGNLIGALENWAKLQDSHECFFMLADLHSITVRQEPAELRKTTLDTGAMLIACGIDPERSVLFAQSNVPEHTQLTWILSCYTGMGECNRMTQFKDKSAQHSENVNVGLFTYPILMASDILLYQADLVPVGEDQKQHLELARNLAQRFNHYYSPTFKVPEPYIPEIGSKIMSLQEPTKKMSKSDENTKAVIFLTDSDEEVRSKIKRAKTDSGSAFTYDELVAWQVNLMTFYQVATGKSFDKIDKQFTGVGYSEFKLAVADAVADYLKPIRSRFEDIRKNEKQLKEILRLGAEKASKTAFKTLRKVYKKVGLISLD